MADQKPVDSNQVKLDQKRATSSAGGVSLSGLLFKVIAVIFVVGNVTALYVLHFVNRPSPTTRFSFSNFVAADGTSAKVGDVVSLSSESKLRNGAGTTAYLDRATLKQTNVSYFEYINLAKSGVSKSTYLTNLMSYRRVKGTTKESVLTTFTVDPATKTVAISDAYDATANVVSGDAIRGISTLSDTSALVLTVDDSTFTYNVYATPATILASGAATLMQSNKKLVATGSATNFITRLDANSAIIAYFDPYDPTLDYHQKVTVATVGSDGKVTLATPENFGPANNLVSKVFVTWGKPVTISSTDGLFVIPYYTSTSGLCVTMSSFSNSKIDTFSDGVCNTNFKPAFFPEGVMLSDNVLLLAFNDAAKNNMLTFVTLSLTKTNAFFRSSFVVPEVAGKIDFGSKSYGYNPEISLAQLAGNRVAVSFMNPSMNGRQSVKVLKYSTETLALKDATPVLPVAPSNFTFTTYTDAVHDKAVTHSVLSVGTDSVVTMHMGNRGDVPHQRVSLVEVYGAPVGILRDYDGKSKASVAISGKSSDVRTAEFWKLAEGQFYYATTSGVVSTPLSNTAASTEYFIASEDASMLVTTDSKVGIAIDRDELFVSIAL